MLETVQSQLSETHLGVSKVTRYKWLTRNEPGELRWVKKDLLQVDPQYQRALNDKKRLRIASNFNWAAFGVILVARRGSGALYVMDGQHRLSAARSRSDIGDVPCIIFPIDSSADEATDFLVANRERKPLTGAESFKAMVASGDPAAITVEQMVSSSGRVVNSTSGPNAVSCLKAMCRFVENDADSMQKVWPLILRISKGHIIDNRMLSALFYIQHRGLSSASGDDDRSLCEADNQRKLVEAGHNAIMQAIGESSAFYNRGGETVWARGVLRILNYKRRNRLYLTGDVEEVE